MKLNYKENIDLNVGAGGLAMYDLINQLIIKEFSNQYLDQLSDQAILPASNQKLAFSTDSYVVSPLFFNGGNIGSLAINGTINDLAMSGATPLYLSVGFILEEGFPLLHLKEVVETMALCAKNANTLIVTGDTKVVEKGKADGIFINTSGIGLINNSVEITPTFAISDRIIVNGSIADHGTAILAHREGLEFESNIVSDCAALHTLVADILATGAKIRCMRDPTRGGVAATLNEWASYYKLGISLDERQILVKNNVASLCEILGLDPLNIANEGKLLMVCADKDVAQVLAAMHKHPLGQEARVIGSIKELQNPYVILKTIFGGSRRIAWLNGDALPRIC